MSQQTFNIEGVDFSVSGVLAEGTKDKFMKRMADSGAYGHYKAEQRTKFLEAAWDRAVLAGGDPEAKDAKPAKK